MVCEYGLHFDEELGKVELDMGTRVGRGATGRRWGAQQARSSSLLLVATAFVSLGMLLLGGGVSRAASARAASTIVLNDSARLHLTSHHGFTLNEQGTASGTIAGTIYIHLNVVSTNRVTAEISIYPKGGSITGVASASYHPAGAVATFNGTMTVQRGTGRYGGARGSGLSFSGTVQRTNDAVTVRVSGRMST
jgi:hypothetical protein